MTFPRTWRWALSGDYPAGRGVGNENEVIRVKQAARPIQIAMPNVYAG